MIENSETQTEFAIWVSQELRIVTFRATEGYEKLTFLSREAKFAHVYRLCQTGYRIL